MTLKTIYNKHPQIWSLVLVLLVIALVGFGYQGYETMFGVPGHPLIPDDIFVKIFAAATIGALVGPYFTAKAKEKEEKKKQQ